ncbi:Alanine--tRNA ligase [Planctomycetes bacterium Pan216]|uniref:Alanine--tRNA ligase n=1 Tax=Kolteria novifilia TaxID=2527975 RepID=A0A518B3P1_9BACT|nr:Alanine--tRNA ligase [Planctomycetes bacterium Pan216]
MKTDELRETYLDFFESKGCVRRPSDLLVPLNDQSVLFTPAGMNQFKEQFLGIGKTDFTRATTCQKCIRTGDIENVGVTPFHMTFFEMLGNFSFGDYFKRDAIHWAWEFVTQKLGIDGNRLTISVYEDDDEAFGIWNEEIKVPSSRIRRCDEEDNFWPAGAPTHGPNGVCGPCSEIFVQLDGGKEVEIWNLVFTQFNRVGVKQLEPLPSKNIDTGMGLERTASVLQGVDSVFGIDILKPIVDAAGQLLGKSPDEEMRRLRRISEHLRTVTFCMHENVMPSNEKQGYVVRRLLRRAVLDAYQLGTDEAILHQLVTPIVEAMKAGYPELAKTAGGVAGSIKAEEERFLNTIDRGMSLFESEAKGEEISGEAAFKLHSTYGFPIELTEELAQQRGVKLDREAYEQSVKQHALDSGSGAFTKELFNVGPIQTLKSTLPTTEFVGYDQQSGKATIKAIIADNQLVEDSVATGHESALTIVLDRTPFYGESGGQVGDVGMLEADGFRFEVQDTQKTDGYHLHVGHIREGSAKIGQEVTAAIDAERRLGIQRAHSATHVLHAGLHQVLGNHATQAGSKVEDDLLRFDFRHDKAVAPEELKRIERFANDHVMQADAIGWAVHPIEEARKMGAQALFGEKYGDSVRVVSMGSFSQEFCGGCHASNTGMIGPIKIVREESVSAGVRRISALTGRRALDHLREQEELLSQAAARVKAPPVDLPKRIDALQQEIRDLKKAASKQQSAANKDVTAELLTNALTVGDAKIVVAELEGVGPADLRKQSDVLKSKASPVALFLASRENEKVHLVAAVSKDLVGKGLHAGKWLGKVAEVVGGKGGGRPDMAQGGGKDPAKTPEALTLAKEIATSDLKG